MADGGEGGERDRTERRPRPTLHFTPPANWMNDPNGLIAIDGEFHLFYQHNPTAPRWGNLHWGHAISHDLMTWDHRPVAITPDEHGEAFSGTVVLDATGTAGLGAGALVAVYTQDLNGLQRQSLAYSLDTGDTWVPYGGNPVLRPPPGIADFRDPKVLRYTSAGGSWWVMVLGVGPEVWVYRSDDLRRWRLASTCEIPTPWPVSIVEVPDLVPVPVEGTADAVWALIVSLIPPGGGRRLGGRVRVLAVDFDGETIAPRVPDVASASLDGGRDFYAAMTWDQGRRKPPVCVGWLDERAMGVAAVDLEWCGRLSLSRSITWIDDHGELRLRQQPVLPEWRRTVARLADGTSGLDGCRVVEPCFAISLTAEFPPSDGGGSVNVVLGSEGARVAVIIDRSGLRLDDGDHELTGRRCSDADTVGHEVLLVVDAGSIEVFIDGGLGVLSEVGAIGLGPTSVTFHVEEPATLVSASVDLPSAKSTTVAT